jgi:RNA polymerase sigma factor (sigma-70 family)
MATGQLRKVVHHLRAATLGCAESRVSDAELLGGFLARRDEDAFATLVRRHGPMVLGLCRRFLRNAQDVEDAFQATFLVLVRRAATVKRPALLGNWLFGVAYRTALAARAKTARRQRKETPMQDMSDPLLDPEPGGQELLLLLDRELERLPEKYRVPLVLCELEGRSRKEAARQLRLAEGTLSSRLAKARKTLARRLARCGLALSASALDLMLAQQSSSACVPASLLAGTVSNATLAAAGPAAAANAIPGPVWALSSAVIRTMLLAKLKTLVYVLAAAVGSLALILLPSAPAAPGQNTSPKSLLVQKDRRDGERKRPRIVVPAALVKDGKVTASIIAIDPDTGTWKKLTGTGIRPRVSPDGQTLVFIRDDGVWNCDTGGSDNPGKLFEGPGYGGAVWSPDGKHLYFSALQGVFDNNVWRHETWQRDPDGGNPVKLKLPAGEAILDVSPDGKYCLTRSRLITRLNSSALMRMKLDGSDARRLSARGGFNEPARFASDGQHIAYCRSDREGFSVWVVRADGGDNRKVFAEAGKFVEACCWSPDGRRLALIVADLIPMDGKQLIPYGRAEGHWQIEIMNSDGKNRRTLPLKAKVVGLRDPDWQVIPE